MSDFPTQGAWTEANYFAIDTNRLIELSDGFLEVLPRSTLFDQSIVDFLHSRLKEFLAQWGKGGRAFFAPVPIRLWPQKLREPDVFYISKANLGDLKKTPEKIDMAMEVVSEGDENRERDLTTKRSEYAKARIPEYWIVDPQEKSITVLVLDGATYREHGVFGRGQTATSVLLPGFQISVDECFGAGAI
ncbi:MAG: Uma2 family endonuclease [Gemmataceae bacterium]|mgnify:CR=1 FL=1